MKLSDERATIVSKIIAVGFGILGYGVVFLVKYLPGVLEVGKNKFFHNLLTISYEFGLCRKEEYFIVLFQNG